MNDENERSVASAGSVAGEPVAWAVALADGERIYEVYAIEEEAKAIDEAVTGNHGVVPLYRVPTLTDAERKAVKWFSGFDHPQNGPVIGKHAATLRGLLERLGGCPEREQPSRNEGAMPARSGETGDDSPERA